MKTANICLEVGCFAKRNGGGCSILVESSYAPGKCPFYKTREYLEKEMKKTFAQNAFKGFTYGETGEDRISPFKKNYRRQIEALESECRERGVDSQTVLKEWLTA